MIKNNIIYDSRSWDGIFCREIALRALGGATNCQVIGWAPGGPNVIFPAEGYVYVLGLPLDAPFGSQEPYDCETHWSRLTWIHNHPDAIRNTNGGVPGFRLAGVANCRLAYAHFFSTEEGLPTKEAFLLNEVCEPFSLHLVQAVMTAHASPFTKAFFRGLAQLTLPPVWGVLLSDVDSVAPAYIQNLACLGRAQGEPAEWPAGDETQKLKDLKTQVRAVSYSSRCPLCDGPVAKDVDGEVRCEGCGWPVTPTCPNVRDVWPLKNKTVQLSGTPADHLGAPEGAKLEGCGMGHHCAICGSTNTPLHTIDYADEPIWVCLGGCKPGAVTVHLSNRLLQQVGDHFEAHLENGKWAFRRIAEPTVDEFVCEQGHRIKQSPLYAELVQWLDQQHITSDSIGSIRRRVLLPWATEWNEIVRQETAARERSLS